MAKSDIVRQVKSQFLQLIASKICDVAPLEQALLAEADRMVGGADAWLIIDDTELLKTVRLNQNYSAANRASELKAALHQINRCNINFQQHPPFLILLPIRHGSSIRQYRA